MEEKAEPCWKRLIKVSMPLGKIFHVWCITILCLQVLCHQAPTVTWHALHYLGQANQRKKINAAASHLHVHCCLPPPPRPPQAAPRTARVKLTTDPVLGGLLDFLCVLSSLVAQPFHQGSLLFNCSCWLGG